MSDKPINSAYLEFKNLLQPTPSDITGPFYKESAPFIESGVIGLPEKSGEVALRVSGQVLTTAGKPLNGAILDIWQADEHGVYDNDGFKLRGKVRTDSEGRYQFSTVMPGDYQISDSPPDFRCAHIHVKVTSYEYIPLTTQLYFPDDKYNKTDHWFDARRVIQHPVGTFDFVLKPFNPE